MTSKPDQMGLRHAPTAFTEPGVSMLSSVLRSARAVRVSIEIMRAFIRLRRLLASRGDLARRVDELEEKYDAQLTVVFDAIRQLMAPPEKPRSSSGYGRRQHPVPVGCCCRPVGFRVEEVGPAYGDGEIKL